VTSSTRGNEAPHKSSVSAPAANSVRRLPPPRFYAVDRESV
jgi:hypothetical protein